MKIFARNFQKQFVDFFSKYQNLSFLGKLMSLPKMTSK